MTTAVLSAANEFDQELIEQVHPPDWENPAVTGPYNLVVIGAGTAGLVSAAGAAGLGAKVALVEKHLLGGDCLNYGCVPSKGIIRVARAAYAVQEAVRFGISAQVTVPPFPQAMDRMRRIRADIAAHDSVRRFSQLGIDVFLGAARFTGRQTLDVSGQRLVFKKAIIATGARATGLPVPGLREAGFLTNETIFNLTERPERLLIIGAGPIGCEMAQTFQRLGSSVSIISLDSQLLPREDTDAAALLTDRFSREGIELALGAKILRVEHHGVTKSIVFDRGRGEERLQGDQILVAVGRAPNIEDLGLDAAGIRFDGTGVKVNEHLQTTNPRVYAAGDICSAYKFTHAAEAMARIALRNSLFFGRQKASSLVIPWCTYTDPEIAHVGMYEAEAQRKGFEVATLTIHLNEIDRARLDGEDEGFARLHIDKKKGSILGATMVSRHAGESIGEIVLAMTQKLPAGSLGTIIHPYPTQAEVWKRLGDQYSFTRFKPWMRRLLTKVFQYRR